MFNEVKSTKNYELFELVKENRDINFKYVDKLIESMKTLDLIVPILVRKNSGSKLLSCQ